MDHSTIVREDIVLSSDDQDLTIPGEGKVFTTVVPLDRAPPQMCDISLLKEQARKPSLNCHMALPVEIIARILDFLPQHRVYPFLSLSKSVNHVAKERLFRQVYVCRGDPFLDDAVDELLHWLFLTRRQFIHLMRLKVKLPARKVFIDTVLQPPVLHDSLLEAIKRHLAPAEVVVVVEGNIRGNEPYFDIPSVVPKPPWKYPYVSRLTLKCISTHPVKVKVKVDSLLMINGVTDIAEGIDLLSVKQLSIVKCYDHKPGNIYKIASRLVNLRELLIDDDEFFAAEDNNNPFPPTVKRLVYHWPSDQYTHPFAEHFLELLEYLETSEADHHPFWPRMFRRVEHDNDGYNDELYKFRKLKLFVKYGAVYAIDRVLGEYYLHQQINGTSDDDDND